MIPNNPDDVTGGYLLEKDHWERYEQEQSGYITVRGGNMVIQSPKYASRKAVEYIQNFVQETEDAINEEDGRNSLTKKHYNEYIDVDSFAKCYLVQEISKNMQMDLTSQFYYTPPGENELLYAGPVWNFDYIFGKFNAVIRGTALSNPRDLLAVCYNEKGQLAFSFTCLYRHKDFNENVKRIYKEEFRGRLKALLDTDIANYADNNRESAMMNQARFEIQKDYDIQIQDIKVFMAARMNYLDEVWEIEE